MSRLPRSIFPGFPHHVMQRGKHDQRVFDGDEDYLCYLNWLSEYIAHYGVEVWAYCLMSDHVHLICVPSSESSLARTFNAVHMRYAQYFNKKKGISGNLWRARFLSCVLDDRSVQEEIRFVETNPIRKRIVEKAEDYPWSSAGIHVKGSPNVLLTSECPQYRAVPDWAMFLRSPGDVTILQRARERLKTGRPAGDSAFVLKLELILGRRLEALPRGRPRKSSLIYTKRETS